jgi:UDP-N-acetylglucosamine 4,6-dehydratase/5-epimerase
VDVIVHAAALKQVPTLEYNPYEAVQTNIIGAENIITAAIDRNVQKVVTISTDKAVNPVNLYGATKLCAEKLFVAGNSYSGSHGTRFSIVRYGNVIGSRGSVVPLFLQQSESGTLTITDRRMTRFWITLDRGVSLVLDAIANAHGGEIFVPKIPSLKISDLVQMAFPRCDVREVGIRPGEKMHEVLLTDDESRHAVELEDKFVIEPEFQWWDSKDREGKALPAGFRYASDTNTQWLTEPELLALVDGVATDLGLARPGRPAAGK